MKYCEEYIEAKKEVVKEFIAETVIKNIDFMGIDFNSIADTQALTVLDEIRNVLLEKKSDRQTVLEIRQIFDKHKMSYEKPLFQR